MMATTATRTVVLVGGGELVTGLTALDVFNCLSKAGIICLVNPVFLTTGSLLVNLWIAPEKENSFFGS